MATKAAGYRKQVGIVELNLFSPMKKIKLKGIYSLITLATKMIELAKTTWTHANMIDQPGPSFRPVCMRSEIISIFVLQDDFKL